MSTNFFNSNYKSTISFLTNFISSFERVLQVVGVALLTQDDMQEGELSVGLLKVPNSRTGCRNKQTRLVSLTLRLLLDATVSRLIVNQMFSITVNVFTITPNWVI